MSVLSVSHWFLIFFFGPLIMLKIYINDKRFSKGDIIYLFVGGLSLSLFYIFFLYNLIPTGLRPVVRNGFIVLVPSIIKALFLFIYLFMIKCYKLKKTFILVFIVLLTYGAAYLTYPAAMLLFPYAEAPFSTDFYSLLSQGTVLLAFFTVAISLPLLLVRLSNKLRQEISKSESAQTMLLCFVAFLFITFSANLIVGTTIWFTLVNFDMGFQLLLMNAFFTTVYGIIVAVSFYMFSRSLKTKYELQRQKDQQEQLHHYTTELEQQQNALRKFRHDYQNILLSLEGFLLDDNLAGVKDYYFNRIKMSFEVITQRDFALAALSNIKVIEIKSILSTKLLVAQTLGIDVYFEADDEVDSIHAESITIVRMLGIILDNAIEATYDIGVGTLRVACFKHRATASFVVQNPCSSDIPPLSQLKQSGFSTKGEARGLGLGILSKLASANPNIMLETIIEGNLFTQKISIEETG